MLRTFIILGLIVVFGGAFIGLMLGVAVTLLWIVLKLAVVGAIIYFIIRIISPQTAHWLRAKFDHQSFPRL